MRWAHSAVDYLAAAVGGDRGEGQFVRGKSGIPLVLGVLEAMVCVCLDHLVNVKPDEEEHTK